MNTLDKPAQVGLFVTCLVDMFRPSVGFATIKLLEAAGCQVSVPDAQTCCGQPAFNSGDRSTTQDIAKRTIEAFDGFEYVVGPSGSCIGMLHHYVELFDEKDPWKARAESLKARAYEVTTFLTEVMPLNLADLSLPIQATYHDSCAGLRELGIKQQPRELLAQVAGLTLNEMTESETCCGFGGTFCVKYPDISNRMVSNKTEHIVASQATLLLGGDMGCLLNMAGKLKREGHAIEVRHVIEVLAGMTDKPAIGEAHYDLGQPAQGVQHAN